MLQTITNPEAELINDLASFTRDPYKFVLYSFPWKEEGELKKFDGPDDWQKAILCEIRDKLLSPYDAIRIAIASGHGPGKSALCSWLILWAMATCPDTRGTVTANTESQLRIKTWPEVAKWHRLFIAKHWFTLTATAIYSNDPLHEKTWRIDIIPWSEHNTEAFAGLHNQGKRIILIFDEASAIIDKIWEVSEGALTDENTEIIWIVVGNPTRSKGRFRECFSKYKHRWLTHQIDSRKCKMTNKEELQKWTEDYGEDSDFVRVRVKGEFPNISERQFIPQSYVDGARKRVVTLRDVSYAAKIIAVEPSWTGADEFVISMRQGNYFKVLAKYAKNDDDWKMAGYIANFEDEEESDIVFIDFGYGTGIYSAGKQMKRHWVLIQFGAESAKRAYVNKRAEMWGDMKDWLRDGGMIPDDPELADEIIGPEYQIVPTGKNAGKIILESKKDMKARGVKSPNMADSLALTFAMPVLPKNKRWAATKHPAGAV